jgi:transglycosylase-like protein with SLT domain
MRAVAAIVAVALAFSASAQEQLSGPPADPPVAEQPTPDTPKPPAPTEAQKSICLLVEAAAQANSLPVEFFARLIWQESRFRANAVGPMTRRGQRAQGIAQFMPGTAAERNLLNPLDPIQALPKSAEFLRDLRSEFGNLGLAAAAYNAGPRRVHEWLAGSGQMPSETRNYVFAITGNTIEQWSKAGAGVDADRKQGQGADCGTLVALLKREPTPFVASLEQHITVGAMQPWGAILGADNSRPRVFAKYAALQQKHATVLTGLDPILIERGRGPLPRYQVRVGAQTRAAANDLCRRMHKERGDCVVLRNPRG